MSPDLLLRSFTASAEDKTPAGIEAFMAGVRRSQKATLEPQTKKTAPGSFSVVFYLQDRKKTY